MNLGDTVKYTHPINEQEGGLRFIVVGKPEKGRVDIQFVCGWRIKPIETVLVTDVEVCES
jgi:hypothetical protein